jgi:hypothetical protein
LTKAPSFQLGDLSVSSAKLMLGRLYVTDGKYPQAETLLKSVVDSNTVRIDKFEFIKLHAIASSVVRSLH